MQDTAKFGANTLPNGIRSRFVNGVNGLKMHILEAGFEDNDGLGQRPCLLLLHGFPELAYSWRKVMGPLRRRAITWWRLISVGMDEPPVGAVNMTMIWHRSDFSI